MGIFPRWAFPDRGDYIPSPPPLPKYDPTVEAPKWNWTKLWYGVDLVETDPDKPKTGGQPINDDKPDWRGVIKKNIIPLKPPEKYEFGNYTPPGYFWFDTPDYADPFKKLRFAASFFFKTGIAATGIYAVIFSYPFDLKSMSYLARRPLAKIWLGGATASVAVVSLANLRGNVDDYWNYAVGGFLAGAMVGRTNHLSFLRQVSMWTPAALFVKWNAETNGKMIPQFDFRLRNIGMALGSGGDYGFKSGDLRPSYFRYYPEDPGRDSRTHVTR